MDLEESAQGNGFTGIDLEDSASLSPPQHSEISRRLTYIFKVALVGQFGGGKTSLASRYVNNHFDEKQNSTLGAAFLSRDVKVGIDKVRFDIWDTSGDERYQFLTPLYFKGAKGVIVLYDITSRVSFQRAMRWVEEIKNSTPNMLIALTGNKVDLESERKVEVNEGEAYAKQKGILFKETSAKTGKNVEELFYALAENRPSLYPRRRQIVEVVQSPTTCCCFRSRST